VFPLSEGIYEAFVLSKATDGLGRLVWNPFFEPSVSFLSFFLLSHHRTGVSDLTPAFRSFEYHGIFLSLDPRSSVFYLFIVFSFPIFSLSSLPGFPPPLRPSDFKANPRRLYFHPSIDLVAELMEIPTPETPGFNNAVTL